MKNPARYVFGCANFGGFGSNPEMLGTGNTEKEAFELLDRAFDLGIRTFDTANTYADGLSEEYLGRWLKGKGSSVRAQLKVATKVGNHFGQDPEKRSLQPKAIRENCEQSLQRLQLDEVDIYFTHMPDAGTPLDETFGAFDQLRKEGKIKTLGASNLNGERLRVYVETLKSFPELPLGTLQNMYHYLERRDDKEVLPLCQSNGIDYWAYSPLCGGLLTGKYSLDGGPEDGRLTLMKKSYASYTTEECFEQIAELKEQAAVKGESLTTRAYAWALEQPGITHLLVSPKRNAHWEPIP